MGPAGLAAVTRARELSERCGNDLTVGFACYQTATQYLIGNQQPFMDVTPFRPDRF